VELDSIEIILMQIEMTVIARDRESYRISRQIWPFAVDVRTHRSRGDKNNLRGCNKLDVWG